MTIYKNVAGLETETKLPILHDSRDLFDKKIRSFLDSIIDPSKGPTVPSGQIIYNQAIIDGIAKSHELGREIEVVIPEI